MNHASTLAMSLLAASLVTGCASQATLQIHSEPQGAYISDASGRLLGTTPLDVSYPFDGKTATCVETGNFTAHWVSGAEEEVRSVQLCGPGYASTLIHRDLSQPGLKEDREFALQLQMLQLQQEQTYAAQQAADAAWASAAAARDAAYAARWSRRGRSGGYRDYDRERHDGNRDGRGYDGDRDGDRDHARRDEAYQEPAAPAVISPAMEPITYVVPEVNPATQQPFIDPLALQAESDRAVQAAAEQRAAEAAAEDARRAAPQEAPVDFNQVAVEAAPEQAAVEQAPAEQPPIEQQSPVEESTRFDDESTAKPEIAEE